jgi:membrane-bound lytic murein transglycosylase F
MRCVLLVALLLSIVPPPARAGVLGTDRYDGAIRDASRLYLPGWDWRWLKAQLYQESRLDPGAVSPAGARGIAQFMPATWAEVAPGLGFGGVSPHAVGPAILASGRYMQRMRRTWSAERPESDRRALAQASYNAGAGNILSAQRACGGARAWSDISACLPQITGKHADETIAYVQRIRRWYGVLIA